MFSPTRHRQSLHLAALASFAVLVLAACGGSSTEATEGVATLESASTGGLTNAADAATEATEADLAPDEAALEFSQCMRDEGLDFPDLAVDAEGNIELREAFQSVDPQQDGFRDAMEACGEVLEQAGFGGGGGRQAIAESTYEDGSREETE